MSTHGEPLRVLLVDDEDLARLRLRALIDGEPVVDLALAGKALSLRPGPTYRSLPLGVATYMTTGAIRGLRLRTLPAASADLRP